MRRECRERFPRHRLQRKPLISDPGMHHGTCVPHMPCCMSWSLTPSGRENAPGIPGACTTRNFTYLTRGPWYQDGNPNNGCRATRHLAKIQSTKTQQPTNSLQWDIHVSVLFRLSIHIIVSGEKWNVLCKLKFNEPSRIIILPCRVAIPNVLH